MPVKLIGTHQPEYQQACQLRYRAFFAEHNLPFTILFDQDETDSFHAVITSADCKVVAYGRLTQKLNHDQISQMVVEPEYQGRGLGQQILQFLILLAAQHRAKLMVLEARTSAMEFYQKLGFKPNGSEYSSKKTGIAHIRMTRLP
ncbi:MAG: GNAT family N-acetyltransferase [Cyanophyceae cyanobacterium]